MLGRAFQSKKQSPAFDMPRRFLVSGKADSLREQRIDVSCI